MAPDYDYNTSEEITAKTDAAAKLSAMGSSWKAAAGIPTMEAYLNASHGFQDGDASGFVQALSAYLRSFYKLLEGGAVNIHLQNYADADGNIQPRLCEKVLVPFYEMLGIPDYLSSRDYSSRIWGEKQITGTLSGCTVYLDGQIESMLLSAIEPILGFLEDLLNMPVDELLDLLPNLFYHLNHGDIADTVSYAVNNLGALGGVVDASIRETIKNLNTNTIYDLLNGLLNKGNDLSRLLGEGSLLPLNLSKKGWDKFVDDVIHRGAPEAVAGRSMDQAWRFHSKPGGHHKRHLERCF